MSHFVPSSENQVDEFLYQTPIAGLVYVAHKKFADERGFYSELARIPELERYLKISFTIKQLNLSHSQQNVIRGLHAEKWNKLLTVISGHIFGAWADLRPESPTFGQVVTLNVGINGPQTFGSVFVASGIANSFCVLEGPVNYVYAVDALYANRDSADDVAISVFDPDLAIKWPLPQDQLVISQRDKEAISLRDKFPDKFL